MKMHAAIVIAADHPAYAGHFPTFPVLPGAILLDETLRALQRERGIDYTAWQVASAKFLDVVRPQDILDLEYEAVAPNLIRFTIRVAERKVASGTLANDTGVVP
jgi:3-hydroxyacyl-[acyl-carrier-protein] dehydratase